MLTDAELVTIWERGASGYYKDHFAFARAVCLADREQRASASEHDPKPFAWAMVADGCNWSGYWAELGGEEPLPERGFTAHPLYDRATLDDAVTKERKRCAQACRDESDRMWGESFAMGLAFGEGMPEAKDAVDCCIKAILTPNVRGGQ